MVATTGIAIELQDKTKQGARAITRSLDDIKKSARETATSVDKLDDNFDKLKDELDKTGRSADKAGREFDALAGKAKRAGDATGGMGRNFTALKGAFAAVGTSIVVKQFFDLLDVSTQINNRLKLVTDSTYALGLAQQQLFEVSQKSRVGFDQTVDLYSRLARSSEELGLTQRELVDITETISQAITISGASAQAADAALMQLGQGIASGTLRGEELNSVLEQTPRLAQAIADGIGVSIGQLRALGAEGALTSETVVKAIQTQQGAVRTEFGETSATIGQSLTTVTNSLTKLVSKIDESAGVSDKFATSLLGIAEGLDALSDRPQIALQGLLGLLTGGVTGLYGRTVQATTALPEREQAQRVQDFEALAFDLEQQLIKIDREFNEKLPDILSEAGQNIERGIAGLLPARVRAASYTTTIPPRMAERGLTFLGPVAAVDESVFGFQDVIDEVDKQIQRETESFIEFGNALGQFSPQLNTAINGFDALIKGDYIGAAISGFMLLTETLGPSAEQVAEFRQQMQELFAALDQGNESAQRIIEDLFFENVSDRQQEILTQFEQAFGFFERGGYGNITNSAEAVRELFDYIARIDVRGASALTEEAFLNLFGQNYQTLRAALDQAFGTTSTFAEIAELMFDTSDSFDHLRESADSAVTSVNRLSQAEQAATRLRINAQEIALRTQLSQEFRRAGRDVFEQRAAYTRFQQAVRQLQYMGRAGAALTGGGGGAGASTTTATTTATGGGAATTTAAQVTTATTQPLTVDFSGDNLVIIRKEIDHWDQLLYGPVWDGTEKPEIDFNGSHKLHIWKRLIDDYNQMLYGPVWDGREKPEIDFNGSHKLHIWKRKINDYDEMFYGPVYDGREKLPVNFGNRIQITGKYALDDWSDIFRGWLISGNMQEPGFRPLRYDFGTPGFVEITGKAQFAIDQLIGLRSGSGFNIEMQYLKDNNLFNVTPADFTVNDLFKFSIGNPIEIDMGFLKNYNLFRVLPAVVSVPELIQLDTTRLIEINLASIINFNASGISEAINAAVKEAISDRSYDAPQRLGYTSGRA